MALADEAHGRQETGGTGPASTATTPPLGPAAAPSISLPKGGGAVRGMGEKFVANPAMGTGSMSVPIATSPGRSGFGPQLALSYDSGAGNGPFGFGWSLSLPALTRKTEKGLPQYHDDGDALESDVFVLSGAEDLVPVLNPDGSRFEDGTTAPGYLIRRYRPRVEGLFARIERWTRADGDVHWRSISKDNILTLYGGDGNSRIADAADPALIFSWLICETRDDKGNAVLYEYRAENGDGVDFSHVHERNRGGPGDPRRGVNRYIKRIRYGNRVPLLDEAGRRPRVLTEAQLGTAGWMFEAVFDYDEDHVFNPVTDAEGRTLVEASSVSGKPWSHRADPFSVYRAGFETRTCRLCQRVLMFHHFADEPGVGRDCLVRSTDLTYSHELDPASTSNPVYSFLVSVTQSGYRRDGADSGRYLQRSLPPVEFEYTRPVVQSAVEEVDAASLENLPVGPDGAAWQWTDLHGEGIPGILVEQAGAWFYKRNISAVSTRPVEFTPLEAVAIKPNQALGGGLAQFMDLAGDGLPDLVVLDGPVPGLYEHDEGAGEEGWQPFRPFESRLGRGMRDPNLKFIDLDGDGHADVLISEDDAFVWHGSLAEKGFGAARRVQQALDEEKGPRLVFADAAQSVYLADLSGDGLTDLVRIRNGEICYWPNLGYGRFGPKVTMDHAPRFDTPDQFDQRRIRLADIDGSGTTDIIYLHPDGVRLYFNQSGNGWSEPQTLAAFPHADNIVTVTVADLLGNGTACLVWASPLPGDAGRQMRYVDLMGGRKPHLLVRTVNNLGAETRIEYASSTKFYLRDKQAGKPWITRLPFPVHVVERVETFDAISRNRFYTRYAYHHGYFDGAEREFRGFGMVEQWDTEELAALSAIGALASSTNIDAASDVPPILTRTWFHTGVYLGRDRVSRFFAGLLDADDVGEYYREPGLSDMQARALLLDDTVLPHGLTLDEEREACRALRNSMLRREIYALDGTDREPHPYVVTEQSFAVRTLQQRGGNRHAVFLTHSREGIHYHYERIPADPRVAHALTLEVDDYGNVLKQAAVGYGRRQPDISLPPADQARQARIHVTCTENRFTNAIEGDGARRTPLPAGAETCEITGLALPPGQVRFALDAVRNAGMAAMPIAYEDEPVPGMLQKRPIERVRTLYRPDDLGAAQNDPLALLPSGMVESLAFPGESYRLAFTPGLLDKVYVRNGQPLIGAPAEVLAVDAPAGIVADRGGYVDLDNDGHWWIPAGRVFLSPGSADTAAQEFGYARHHFFLPHRYRNPFHLDGAGTETFVTYDIYDLLMLETRDALDNRVTVGERLADGSLDPARPGNDYRVLQPWRTMDPNRNRAQVAFDVLGMIAGTAVMGKPGETLGDTLEGAAGPFDADPGEAEVLAQLASPLAGPHVLLGRATTRLVYDLFAYQRTRDQPAPQPAVVHTLARETHDADLQAGQTAAIQYGFSYSDGFGREIQKKMRAAPGPVPVRDMAGNLVLGANGQPEMTAGDADPRWRGSGWTVFNNKGKPVRQYEPFFTDTHRFEFDVRIGVSPVVFYDPMERMVATLHPNHTWEKSVFDPWRQETWDVNDTVLVADPRNDPVVGDFFRRLPDAAFLPTWHARRQGGALGPREQDAARKTAVHAATPAATHLDSLARAFLAVAHNRFKYSNTPAADPPVEAFHARRVVFDIEGNEREIVDAAGRTVMRYAYDMLGNRIHGASMEAGERFTLNDVAGKPVRNWDSLGHGTRTEYDPLRRPVRTFVTDSDPADPGGERMTERLVYGEQHPEAELRNLRGSLCLRFDQAGVASNEVQDFKKNLLRSARRLGRTPDQVIGWTTVDAALPSDPLATLDPAVLETAVFPLVEDEAHANQSRYDALNRAVEQTTSDTSMALFHHDEGGELRSLEVNLRGVLQNGSPVWTPFVTGIRYDAKGRRTAIVHGNGVATTYEYDPLTFRLVRLHTVRAADDLQDLNYTYDPGGNITHIRDDAQQTIYFRNRRVDPDNDYLYDALYHLIEATGREHLGQIGGAPAPHSFSDAPRVGIDWSANDGNAMGTYLERYLYDPVGNIVEMQHRGSDPLSPGWTRGYEYAEPNNRLSSTTVGGQPVERYVYDLHGNMTRVPHAGGTHPDPNLRWDYRNQLDRIDLGGGGTAYYRYDSAGQRARKVWQKAAGLSEERIYLGNFEIHRRRNGAGQVTLARETLHIMDGQRRIAMIETRTVGSDPAPEQLIRYQFGNHLGSAVLELDGEAGILSYEEYTPFGSTSYQAVRSQADTPKRYRYSDRERDEESGFCYHGARYYAPWLGRWTAADPAGLVDGDNLYRYSRNNPARFTDPNGMDPPPPPRGEYRLPGANPISDPLAQASYFDLLFPGLFGLGLGKLDLGNRTSNAVGGGFLRFGEFAATGLLFYGPVVLSHEYGGHVGAAQRFGLSGSLTEFSWFSALVTWSGGATQDQTLTINAAGVNQQTLNAGVTYTRIARTGYFNPQDAWAYFLGQAGTPFYALRTLSLANPPPSDDIDAYSKGPRSWSTGGIAGGSVVTMLPSLAALGWIGYQFVFNNRRTLEVPSLHIGSARLTFPHLQTLLTPQGTVLGASTVLSLGRDRAAFQFGLDVRPTSDFALSIGARAYGLRFPGSTTQINPYVRFTAADPPGIFGGVEIGLNPFPWLGFTGSIEGGINDLRSPAEGRSPGFGASAGGVLRF